MTDPAKPRVLREFYEDYAVGDKLTTPGRTITEADLVQFASFSSDWNAVHTDQQYAQQQTPFGGRIAHGLLGLVAALSLFFRQWCVYPPASWAVLSGLDRVRFDAPIHIGDTIHLEAEVMEATPMPDGKGILSLRVRVRNQVDTLVIACRLKLVIGCRPAPEAPRDPPEGNDHG